MPLHVHCPADPLRWALQALLLASSCAWVTAAALTCPELPPAPAGTRRFALSAGLLSQASPWQTLAYNDTRGWGPVLQVALGETMQVDVTNAGIEEGTTVHWHGQHLVNASWADGAEGLTQAPIPTGTTFSYRFTAGPAGTHWYHAHTGVQFGSGLRGALVVTDPDDPAKALYDEDSHLLLLADVFNTTTEQQLEELRAGGHFMAMCPGVDVSDVPWGGVEVNGESFGTTGRATVLRMQRGRRYRVRTVSGASSWALRLAVQGHNVSVIAVDGAAVAPALAASFVLASGQRADFVLTADQAPANYWINVSTLDGHVALAILHYEGAPDPAGDPAVAANAYQPHVGCPPHPAAAAAADLDLSALQAGQGVPPLPKESTRQLTVYLVNAATDPLPPGFKAAVARPGNAFGLSAAAAAALPEDGASPACPDGSAYCWALNWNVYEMPTSLAVYGPEADAATQAAAGAIASTGAQLPRTYAVTVQPGEVVDLLLLNPQLSHLMSHPMHLHGGAFWLLAVGQGAVAKPDGSIDWEAPALKRTLNLQNPPLVDTVAVPQAAAGDGMADSMADSMAANAGGTSDSGADAKPHACHGSGSANAEAKPAPKPAVSAAHDNHDANTANADAASTPHDSHTGHRRSLRAAAVAQTGQGTDAHASHAAHASSSGGTATASAGAAADNDGGNAPGFALVRVRFDHPGLFAFHCHIDMHAGSGMMLHFVVPGWSAPPSLECGATSGMAHMAHR